MIADKQIVDLWHDKHWGRPLDFARAIESLVAQDKDKRSQELESEIFIADAAYMHAQELIASLKESLALAQDIIDTEPKPQQVEQSHAQASPDSVRDAVIAGALFDFLGMLTTQNDVVCMSGHHEAGVAVTMLRRFAEMRGLNLDEARVNDWREAMQSQAPSHQHRIADARNPVITSGYICVDCGALFAAADHEAPSQSNLKEEK